MSTGSSSPDLADPAIVYSMADVDPGKDYPILVGGQARSPDDLRRVIF